MWLHRDAEEAAGVEHPNLAELAATLDRRVHQVALDRQHDRRARPIEQTGLGALRRLAATSRPADRDRRHVTWLTSTQLAGRERPQPRRPGLRVRRPPSVLRREHPAAPRAEHEPARHRLGHQQRAQLALRREPSMGVDSEPSVASLTVTTRCVVRRRRRRSRRLRRQRWRASRSARPGVAPAGPGGHADAGLAALGRQRSGSRRTRHLGLP